MRIQPVQGSGMNAGYDAATGSITISNEGNSPFIYVRVNRSVAKVRIRRVERQRGKDVYRNAEKSARQLIGPFRFHLPGLRDTKFLDPSRRENPEQKNHRCAHAKRAANHGPPFG